MKVIGGFVSNSSSSSFVILLKDNTDDECDALYLDTIKDCLPTSNRTNFDIDELYEYLKEESIAIMSVIEDLENDIELIKCFEEEIDDRFVENYKFLDELKDDYEHKSKFLNKTFVPSEYDIVKNMINKKRRDVKSLTVIKDSSPAKEWLDCHILKCERLINKAKEILSKHKEYMEIIKSVDISWQAFYYEIDPFNNDRMNKIIDKSVKKGIIKIIK